jgi:hypothetical protein
MPAFWLSLSLLIVGCGKKKDENAGKEPPAKEAGAPSGPVRVKEKGSLVSLYGEMKILPGMKVASEQLLELREGIVTTVSPGGKAQGRLTMTDKERRKVDYVSENEKTVVLEEKQAILHMETGGAEPVDTDMTSVLEGRKLTARRRKDGQWWFGLAEGEADAEATNELVDLGEREVLVIGAYPLEPRALGDSWESPLATVSGLLGTNFEASEGTVTMRLDRLSSFEGQRCAEISVTLACSGTYSGTGSPMTMKLEMTGSILRSLNAFQDLRITLDGPVTLEANPEEETHVSIAGTIHLNLENHVTRE